MLIFDDTELMLARGKYSTLGAERKDELKKVQAWTDRLMSAPNKILQGAQEYAGHIPQCDPRLLVADVVATANLIDRSLMRIAELDKQRAELRPLAWPK